MRIADLVRQFGMSETALKVLVRHEAGVSVGELVRHERMDTAAELLKSGVPIAKTAEMVGYKTPEALSKAMKKQIGKPPGKFAPRV